MRLSSGAVLVAGAGFTIAQSELVGTWTTKSNSTITGPAFYDPIEDEFIEPAHPGISYSFTDDGNFESAYYRAIADPTNPECPGAILQWQHGSYEYLANGSLILTPITSDGRQLESNPCKGDKSIFARYNQSELFDRYSQYVDPYHGIPRLDLYQFNGAPLPPMYLVYKPPQMLPTTTLQGAPTSTASNKLRRFKRDDHKTRPSKKTGQTSWLEPSNWWWFGVGMTGLGSALYYCV